MPPLVRGQQRERRAQTDGHARRGRRGNALAFEVESAGPLKARADRGMRRGEARADASTVCAAEVARTRLAP
jgi:hypothetical protein